MFDSSSSKNGGVYAKEDDCYGINISGGANLTIESGTYIGNISAIQVVEGNLTIKNGHFDLRQKWPLENDPTGYLYEINCIDDNYIDGSARVNIEGGTFVGFNPSDNYAEGKNTNFVSNGHTITSTSHPTVDKILIYTVTKA